MTPVDKPAGIELGNNRIANFFDVMEKKAIPRHMHNELRKRVAAKVTGRTSIEDYRQVCAAIADAYIQEQVNIATDHELKRQQISELDQHFGPREQPSTITIKDWLALPEGERPAVRYNHQAVQRILQDVTYNDNDHYVIWLDTHGTGSKRGKEILYIDTADVALRDTLIWWTNAYNQYVAWRDKKPSANQLRKHIAGVDTFKGLTSEQCEQFKKDAEQYLITNYPLEDTTVTDQAPEKIEITKEEWQAWIVPWLQAGYTKEDVLGLLTKKAAADNHKMARLSEWPYSLHDANAVMIDAALNDIATKQPSGYAAPGTGPMSADQIRAKYTIKIKRKGKNDQAVYIDYLQTAGRILLMRIDHPDDWGIETELLALSDVGATVKAVIRDDANMILATAHAYTPVANSANFGGRVIEKAETAAIGRALALVGYGTDEVDSDLDE